jgi:hypothetical protein
MQPENKNDLFTDLSFDFTAKQYIRSIASWAVVIAVVSIIGLTISIIQLFTAPEVVTSNSEGFDFNMTMRMGSETKVGTVIGVVIRLVLIVFLLRFASQARTGLNGLNQSALNSSFNSLKTYFMVAGIVGLLIFVVILFALVAVSV